MSSLYGVIGTWNPEYLLADPQGADMIAIPCEPGNGTVPRGTVMYRKSSGMYAPAASGNVLSTNNLVVLDEEVNTSESLTVAEDARAFRAGHLISGKVVLAAAATVTAAYALILRQQGIVLEGMDDMDEFDNTRVVITYKANEGTGDDVVVYADSGSTYAIAANTFTAPEGDVFKEWNTAAAGTGTAYDPADSYTASANLTLYAIWELDT